MIIFQVKNQEFNHFFFICSSHIDLRLLLGKFYDDWKMPRKFEQHLTMRKNAKTSKKFILTIVVLCFSTCIAFNLGWLLILLDKLANNGERFLIIKSYYPYDAYKSPWFEMTWMLHCVSSFLASMSSTGFDCLFGVLVMHLCGQYELISKDLDDIKNCKSRLYISKSIVLIGKRHQQVNRLVKHIQKCFIP